MERRRLRLHSPHAGVPAQAGRGAGPGRFALPGRCLTVTDTEQGHTATLWALGLLESMARRGERLPVVFTGFEQLPDLPRELEPALSAAASQVLRERIDPAGGPPEAGLRSRLEDVARARFWLMVGLPALLAFEGWLPVLLTGEREPLRWPEGLRRLRPSLALELPEPRPAVSDALAHALLTTPEP